MVSGEVQRRYGIQIAAKNVEVVDDPAGMEDNAHAGRFVPVYPVNKNIQARRMRTLIHRALDEAGHVLDPLPGDILVRHGLGGYQRCDPGSPLFHPGARPSRARCGV